MRYRTLLSTAVAVIFAVALLAIWLYLIAGIIHATPSAAIPTAAEVHPGPERALRRLVLGTIVLALMLISSIIFVGIAASIRQWLRRKPVQRKPTPYVDAWKLAGERLKEE